METGNTKHLEKATNASTANSEYLRLINQALQAANTLVSIRRDLTGEVVAMWAKVMSEAGIRGEELAPAVIRHCQKIQFFPSTAEIIEHVQSIRQERFRAQEYTPALPEPIQSPEEEAQARTQRREQMRQTRAESAHRRTAAGRPTIFNLDGSYKTDSELIGMGLKRMKPPTPADMAPAGIPTTAQIRDTRQKAEDQIRRLRDKERQF